MRRAREQSGLSQAALARLLEISPSYLNQIEHNQRPLTTAVLLRIRSALGTDARLLTQDDEARLVAGLHDALSDPAAGLERPPSTAMVDELAASHPEIAAAVITLHRRATDRGRRVEELAIGLGARLPDGASHTTASPYDEVLDFVYDNRNHFADLDHAAERLADHRGLAEGAAKGLERLLLGRHGIRIVDAAGSDQRRRYDSTERVLAVSPRLNPTRRAFQLAAQWALLEHADEIERHVTTPGLSSQDSRGLARIGLANYFAGAVVLPYRRFLADAEHLGYDIALLADRYGAGLETVCHRLSTLQRPGAAGVPFFFVRVDRAGNIGKRHSATDFHFSRIGGTCPLWNVYEAFSTPGRFTTQVAQMPDGRTYLWVARSIARGMGGYGTPGVEYALGLGCDIRHAKRLVYGRSIALDDPATAVPIGPGCRLCERTDCPQRAFPPIGRALAVDENQASTTPYPAH